MYAGLQQCCAQSFGQGEQEIFGHGAWWLSVCEDVGTWLRWVLADYSVLHIRSGGNPRHMLSPC